MEVGGQTVSGFRTFLAEVTSLLAVAASNVVHVSGLIALASLMALLAAIATATAAALRAIFGKVAHYVHISKRNVSLAQPHSLSLHLRHSTFSGFGGSSQSAILWPDFLAIY